MIKFSLALVAIWLSCACLELKAAPRSTPPIENSVYRNARASNTTLVLAQNGQALLPIVIAEKADTGTKALAEELADYLKQISGATFEVKAGDGSEGIVVGTLDEFPTPNLEKPLEINGVDGREAFAIRTTEKRVLLLGATSRAVPHVVYRFLDELGVRWFFPAQHWTVVPSTPALKWNREITDRPTILNRGIWASWGYFGDTPEKRWNREWNNSRSAHDYEAWKVHNLQGGSMQVNTGHSWFEIIKANNEIFAKHPEYYALVGGERKAHWEAKVELSNPAVRQIFVDHALNYFKNNPDADMVSLDPSDGGGWSESAESAAMGTVSDQVFTMVNEAARAVQKKYPGKMVGVLAYNFHAMPPSFDLEPNVYVQMPTAFVQGKYSLDDLIELWPQKTKNFGFYDYYSVWLWRHDFLPGGTAANVPGLAPKIKDWAKIGVTSISAESGNDWGLSGRGYYIAAKLMWNPNADVEALSEDFYQKAFGPGAPAMKRYYERVEGANKARLSRNTYALALRDVDEAGVLARGDEAATARVDDIKQYLRYQHLNWEWDRVNTPDTYNKATPEKEKAWNARIEQTYRERFSYMTHFAAQLANGYADWDNIAKHPELFPDKPYSREERDAQWREMLSTYKPLEVHEHEYSRDVVAVNFGLKFGSETRQHFAGRAGFFFVTNGAPLQFTIQTDALPGFENRPDARYTIADASGKTVAQERMQLDGQAHDLSFDLPAGTYSLDFDGAQGSWTLIAPKELPVSQMLLKQWPRTQQGPAQDMYFYVPAGTREIELSWNGEPLQLMNQKGDTAPLKARNDDHFIYTVPPGTDGQVWAIPQFALGHLWFYNMPNFLAASPEALPVPREVAQADGLVVRR
jgi:hypothetical protein